MNNETIGTRTMWSHTERLLLFLMKNSQSLGAIHFLSLRERLNNFLLIIVNKKNEYIHVCGTVVFINKKNN